MKLPWFLVLLAACSSSLQEENRRLEGEITRLKKERDEARFWLGKYRVGPPWDRIGWKEPWRVDAKVIAAAGKRITISVGSDQRVRVGDTCHLRRGASYVGQMRIDRVESKTSEGVFDEEFAGDGAPARPGDVAYTGNG